MHERSGPRSLLLRQTRARPFYACSTRHCCEQLGCCMPRRLPHRQAWTDARLGGRASRREPAGLHGHARRRDEEGAARTGVGDLIRVHVMLLRQLGQRLVASYGGQRHLGLECRRVRAAGSSAHACSSSLGRNPRPQEQCPPSLIGLFRFAGPALPASTSRTRRKRTNEWTNSVCGDDQPPIGGP
jgi:hypothetical protein